MLHHLAGAIIQVANLVNNSRTCVKRLLLKKHFFHDHLSLNEGQKYRRNAFERH